VGQAGTVSLNPDGVYCCFKLGGKSRAGGHHLITYATIYPLPGSSVSSVPRFHRLRHIHIVDSRPSNLILRMRVDVKVEAASSEILPESLLVCGFGTLVVVQMFILSCRLRRRAKEESYSSSIDSLFQDFIASMAMLQNFKRSS